jgi:hypothetical protein
MATYQMPDPATRRRAATRAEILGALRAARCSARLAGLETDEFVVRELLLSVIDQISLAERAVARLASSSVHLPPS